jgi:hypothetical protein
MLVGAGRWASLIGRLDGSQNVRVVIGELRMAVGADDVCQRSAVSSTRRPSGSTTRRRPSRGLAPKLAQ